jgi:hypothetical protein
MSLLMIESLKKTKQKNWMFWGAWLVCGVGKRKGMDIELGGKQAGDGDISIFYYLKSYKRLPFL